MKLDCEGSEWGLLEDRESWRHVRFLTMEYHLFDGQPHDSIVMAVEQLGFKLHSMVRSEGFGLVLAERLPG